MLQGGNFVNKKQLIILFAFIFLIHQQQNLFSTSYEATQGLATTSGQTQNNFGFKTICPEDIVLPKPFVKGVALSVFQNSGDPNANWSYFARKKSTFGQPTIKDNQDIGVSCDFWNNFQEDIPLAKELGCNSLRLSFEWSRIEPEQGEIDHTAIKRYHEIIDCIIKHGMQPMVTLHHFTHPQWFEQMEAFENDENIELFVDFCRLMFKEFNSKVKLWCTINEPTVLSSIGYVLGLHAPGKFLNLSTAGHVLKNLLRAHVQVYKALKEMADGEVQIGLVHALTRFQGYKPFYVHTTLLAHILDFILAHKITLRFLQTGVFEYKIPGFMTIRYEDESAPQSFDFIGLC